MAALDLPFPFVLFRVAGAGRCRDLDPFLAAQGRGCGVLDPGCRQFFSAVLEQHAPDFVEQKHVPIHALCLVL